MIERIKQVVADYCGGDREWFMICLATGGWVYHDQREHRYYQEWRITLPNGIQVDIQDLDDGHYRVSVGTPRSHGLPRWDTEEFADTSEADRGWAGLVSSLLDRAHRDPNIVTGRLVV